MPSTHLELPHLAKCSSARASSPLPSTPSRHSPSAPYPAYRCGLPSPALPAPSSARRGATRGGAPRGHLAATPHLRSSHLIYAASPPLPSPPLPSPPLRFLSRPPAHLAGHLGLRPEQRAGLAARERVGLGHGLVVHVTQLATGREGGRAGGRKGGVGSRAGACGVGWGGGGCRVGVYRACTTSGPGKLHATAQSTPCPSASNPAVDTLAATTSRTHSPAPIPQPSLPRPGPAPPSIPFDTTPSCAALSHALDGVQALQAACFPSRAPTLLRTQTHRRHANTSRTYYPHPPTPAPSASTRLALLWLPE